MDHLRPGENLIDAIKKGDRQGLETTLHGMTKTQAQAVLHYTHKYKPSQKLTPLLATIKFRRLHMMTYLLRVYSVDVDQRGDVFLKYTDKYHLYEKFREPNVTALWYAAAEDLLDYVRPLVETFHADVNARTGRNNTPLHFACLRGNLDMMTFLLKHGADPNVKSDCDGLTALLCVLPIGLTTKLSSITYNTKNTNLQEKIQVLLEHGADINARSRYAQLTLLHAVAETGIVPLYQYVIDQGALFVTDKFDLTPLHCACLNGNEELYDYICSLPETSDEDKLTGFELIYVHFLLEDFLKCFCKIDELVEMREKLGQNTARKAAHSIDSIWLEDYQPKDNDWDKSSIWKEGLIIVARHFGTDSIHFALRLFQSASHRDLWGGRDNTVIMLSALETLCLKYKVATTYLPVFVTLQIVRHLEASGNCYQHNFPSVLKIMEMCFTVLQTAHQNLVPMVCGRTANIIEVNSYLKAAMDAIALLIAHRIDIFHPKFKNLAEGVVNMGDKLAEDHLCEYSFFQWILDQPRVEGPTSYCPAKHFDVLFYAAQCRPDVNVYNYLGDNSLHIFAKYNDSYTDSQFIRLLNQFEACNAHFDLTDVNGFTAAELCAKYNPDRAHYFIRAANPYISLKCLASKAVQRSVPQYTQFLPKQLEKFVDLH